MDEMDSIYALAGGEFPDLKPLLDRFGSVEVENELRQAWGALP